MALKLRKDIKKSSYYVWFLGAKESKGLRGSEYIIPVIRHLEEREKDVEPFKVTLQVSHKGLKIIQNVVSSSSSQGQKNSKPKNETIKHFIPHNTISYVYQHEDIIACILLLFNPVTKCPLHVHAYRCDSLETASHLKQQLQILIDRPENQKKMCEIENRLKPIEKMKKLESSTGSSDTGTSTRESESSEERFALENSRISSLYDSVAAELRAKLGKKNSPILLPPRDYDTVHRQKGNLTGIELRRCLNSNIVGQNVANKAKRIESSGGSSGIGSDHPPSPESPSDTADGRFHLIETHSTSDDEDWNGDPAADSSLYLVHHGTQQVSALQRPLVINKNQEINNIESNRKFLKYSHHQDLKYSKSYDDDDYNQRKPLSSNNNIAKYLEKPITKFTDNKYLLQRQKSTVGDEITRKSLDRANKSERSLYYNNNNNNNNNNNERKYYDDDGFDENIRCRNSSTDFDKVDKASRSFSYEEEVFYEDQKPIPKIRQRLPENKEEFKPKCNPNDPRYYEPNRSPQKNNNKIKDNNYPEKYYYEGSINRRQQPQFRQRSPSPNPNNEKAPRDRFKDAKEKFLSMEKERILNNQRTSAEPPISPTIQKDKIHFIKRHQSMAYPSNKDPILRHKFDDRYSNNFPEEIQPKPTPSRYQHHEEIRYRQRDAGGLRSTDKYDPKRRSMFSLIEEEHKKNSNEIAKELLKRRSYVEFGHQSNSFNDVDDEVTDDYRGEEIIRDNFRGSRHNNIQDFSESERYNSLLNVPLHHQSREEQKYDSKFVKNSQKNVKTLPGYRHSYAEPKIKIEQKKKTNLGELLHRNNSTLGYLPPRVGIASIHHPY